MSAGKETSKTSEGVLLDFRTLVQSAQRALYKVTSTKTGRVCVHFCCYCASKRYYMSEAMVSALKTADKTMAKGKGKQSWFGKRREKRKAGERSVVLVSLSSL